MDPRVALSIRSDRLAL